MTREEVERFFRRRHLTWKDRDARALALDHAEDCIVESPTHGRLTTREQIQQVYATWLDAFPDLMFSTEDLLVEGDRAVLFFRTAGTHMKSFANVPPSGRRLEIRGALLYTFRDGMIVHETRYYDATAVLLQIGLLKAKPM